MEKLLDVALGHFTSVIMSDPNIPEDVETLVLDSFVEISPRP